MIIDHQIFGWFVKWANNVYCLSSLFIQNWKNFISFVFILKINLQDQQNDKEKIRDKTLALLGHNLSQHGQTLYYRLHSTDQTFAGINLEY